MMIKDVKKKTSHLFLFCLILSLTFLFSVSPVFATPNDWHGTVRINGLIAPAGTVVTAYLNGDEDVNASVRSSPAGYYLITVAGNGTNPAAPGDSVTFKINSADANEGTQTFTATPRDHSLDLSATQAADSSPPTRSSGLPTGNITSTSTTLQLATDEAAICKYGTTASTDYSSISNTFSTTGGKSHSQSLTSLASGTTYSYYVRCIDSVGNNNTDDYTITFTVNTSANDTTAPVRSSPVPANHTQFNYTVTNATVGLTTDETANCSWSASSGTAYAAMTAFNNTAATTHNGTFKTVAGTERDFYVKCNDTSGNINSNDYLIYFTVASIYQNATINTTANVTLSLDAKNITNTTLDMQTIEDVTDEALNITTSTDTLANISLSVNEFKYLQVQNSSGLNETVISWVMLKIYYTEAELGAADIADENTLVFYWYNETSGSWTRLNATSMSWVYGTGVNTVSNYVWANVSHLSIFALGGLKGNGFSCSGNGDCQSGFCRSDYDGGSFCAKDSTSCVHGGSFGLQYSEGSTCIDSTAATCSAGVWTGYPTCSISCSGGTCATTTTTTTTIRRASGAVVTTSTTTTTLQAYTFWEIITFIDNYYEGEIGFWTLLDYISDYYSS